MSDLAFSQRKLALIENASLYEVTEYNCLVNINKRLLTHLQAGNCSRDTERHAQARGHKYGTQHTLEEVHCIQSKGPHAKRWAHAAFFEQVCSFPLESSTCLLLHFNLFGCIAVSQRVWHFPERRKYFVSSKSCMKEFYKMFVCIVKALRLPLLICVSPMVLLAGIRKEDMLSLSPSTKIITVAPMQAASTWCYTSALKAIIAHHKSLQANNLSDSFAGVPVYRVVQNPGDYVITFPRSYHGGFSNGFCVGEAVNFGFGDWYQYGVDACSRYSRLKKLPMLDQEALLVLEAQHLASKDHLSFPFLHSSLLPQALLWIFNQLILVSTMTVRIFCYRNRNSNDRFSSGNLHELRLLSLAEKFGVLRSSSSSDLIMSSIKSRSSPQQKKPPLLYTLQTLLAFYMSAFQQKTATSHALVPSTHRNMKDHIIYQDPCGWQSLLKTASAVSSLPCGNHGTVSPESKIEPSQMRDGNNLHKSSEDHVARTSHLHHRKVERASAGSLGVDSHREENHLFLNLTASSTPGNASDKILSFPIHPHVFNYNKPESLKDTSDVQTTGLAFHASSSNPGTALVMCGKSSLYLLAQSRPLSRWLSHWCCETEM